MRKTLLLNLRKIFSGLFRKKHEYPALITVDTFLNSIPKTAIIVVDNNGSIVKFNPGAELMFGYSFQEVIGINAKNILYVPANGPQQIDKNDLYVAGGSKSEWLYRRKDGSEFWGELTFQEIKDSKGEPQAYISIINDITLLKSLLLKLEKNAFLMNNITKNIPVAIYMNTITTENKIIFKYISEGVSRVFNMNADELLDENIFDTPLIKIIHPDDIEHVKKTANYAIKHNTPWQADFRIMMEDNTISWVHGEDSPETQPDGSISRFGSFINISEMKKKEDIFRVLSQTDALTGIFNRRYFNDYFPKIWQQHIDMKTSLAIIMIDIDFFKQYNDIYGHIAGDTCIKKVTDSLILSVRNKDDLLVRYGGEEFLILLSHCSNSQAFCITERMRKAVESLAIPHTGSIFGRVTLSIGIKPVIPSHTPFAMENSVQDADLALYQAKKLGRNRVMLHE